MNPFRALASPAARPRRRLRSLAGCLAGVATMLAASLVAAAPGDSPAASEVPAPVVSRSAAADPRPPHPRTEQVEHVAPAPLLDAEGNVQSAGWARRAWMTYDRSRVPAALQGRVKEWEHYTIMSPAFTLGVTIAQLGPISFGSFEAIEYPDPATGEGGGIQPGGFFLVMGVKDKSIFPDHPHGDTTLESDSGRVTLGYADGKRKISFEFAAKENLPAIEGEIELVEAGESVAIARPFAEPNHFFYENKIFGMPASGSARVGAKEYVLPEGARAIFDWGRGVWPHEVTWFWGQASGVKNVPAGAGRDGAPRAVSMNLGHGYGDDSKGTCNAILVDGRIHKTDTVFLEYDPADRMKPWKIGSNDGRIELDFRPVFNQHAKQSIPIVGATELHKIHGRFSGRLVLDDGSAVEVKEMLGFMEHAEHLW